MIGEDKYGGFGRGMIIDVDMMLCTSIQVLAVHSTDDPQAQKGENGNRTLLMPTDQGKLLSLLKEFHVCGQAKQCSHSTDTWGTECTKESSNKFRTTTDDYYEETGGSVPDAIRMKTCSVVPLAISKEGHQETFHCSLH